MSLANLVLAVIWVGVSAYAVFGGADFGAGIWDLFAGNATQGRRARARIERSLGPVWEANHVWLIFILVYLWTAFPTAFTSVATTMIVPLMLAAIGIIFRGAGFAFRKYADTLDTQRIYGVAFAGASLLTPFFLGAVAGGAASGRVPIGNATGDLITAWLNPTSVLGGVMAVIASAYLAAVLLTRDAAAAGDDDLVEYFRRRAIASGVAAGALAAVGIGVIAVDANELFDGLTSPGGTALIVASAVGGLASLRLLSIGRASLARGFAVLAVVTVLWGWAVGQYPDLLVGALTVEEAAASPAVLSALLFAFAAAVVIVIPSLAWLFVLDQRGALDDSAASEALSTDQLLRSLLDEKT